MSRSEIDPSGASIISSVDMNARVYDPEVGRFISPDPILGNSSMPGTFNPYNYGVNNPYGYPDPSGLSIGHAWEGLSNLLYRGAKFTAKPFPVIGAAATYASNRCNGDSVVEASMKTGGAVAGGAGGTLATGAICTSGVGTPVCLASGAGLAIAGSEIGEEAGGDFYDFGVSIYDRIN